MGPTRLLNDLPDEELARSRYEEREVPDARPATRLVFGLLVANAIILVKELLFGSQGSARQVASEMATNGADTEAVPARDDYAARATTSEQEEPTGHLAAQSSSQLSAPRSPVVFGLGSEPIVVFATADSLIPIRFPYIGSGSQPTLLPAVNDNGGLLFGGLLGRGLVTGTVGGTDSGKRASTGGTDTDEADQDEEETPPPPFGGRTETDDDDADGSDNGSDDETDDADERTNRAPTSSGHVLLGPMFINQTILIGLSVLASTVSDADGDTLAVRQVTASTGTLIDNGNSTWTYTAARDELGEVVFTYEITDGQDVLLQLAYLNVVQLPGAEFVGTDGDDRILGTPGDDQILALGGNDIVVGREGRDVIDGGDGDDRLMGGDGNDVIYGGAGNDVIFGEGGNDVLFGGGGDDILFGGDGDDLLDGGEGNDVLVGNAGHDLLIGGQGNDVLIGGAGNDVAMGGEGDDVFIAEVSDGNDVYDGGDGIDTLDLSLTSASAVVDMVQGTATSAEIGSDTIASIENIIGSRGDDLFIGDGADNVLIGNSGDDMIHGGDGDDVFVAGQFLPQIPGIVLEPADGGPAPVSDGNDHYIGGEGTDTLDLSAVLRGVIVDLEAGVAMGEEIGSDTLESIENVIGSQGDDVIIANDSVNIFTGGPGDDVFVFRTIASAGLGKGSRDRISDFEVGDRIDIDDISREFAENFEDALRDEGIRKFVLIESGAAFDAPGQIRLRYDGLTEGGLRVTIVEGNVDYDTETEFEIEIYSHSSLVFDQIYYHHT